MLWWPGREAVSVRPDCRPHGNVTFVRQPANTLSLCLFVCLFVRSFVRSFVAGERKVGQHQLRLFVRFRSLSFAFVRSLSLCVVWSFRSSEVRCEVRCKVPKFVAKIVRCKVRSFVVWSFRSSKVRCKVRCKVPTFQSSKVPKFQSSEVPIVGRLFVRSNVPTFVPKFVRSFQSSSPIYPVDYL